ncbi:MAG: phosphocholine cytidylyltransferase family protein [Magnetospirillum sp.]|nr:phosphocholine cytidylyltransferase family protein [Magnetospirillum sp.]
MKVIILAAGQGRRLLPWTHDLPKCLLPFAERPLLGWQLQALAANRVDEVVVVTGFGATLVEAELARLTPPGLTVTTIFNPFYGVADNIASCWAARQHLMGEVAVVNGDTLFEPAVLAQVRDRAPGPVSVTTDVKPVYDADDMKVQIKDGKVARIGKTLPAEATDAESIGLIHLRGLGGALFAAAVEAVMHQPRGVSRWYLSAVDDLAARGMVAPVSIAGLDWTEVDYPGDLGRAEMLARGWVHSERRRRSAALAP